MKFSNKTNVSSLNPFSCKIQIFKVRVKVSYFSQHFKNLQRFSWKNHGHDGHEHGVRRGVFEGKLSFKKMSAGDRLCTLQKKNPIFGSQRSKLDHLTVLTSEGYKDPRFLERPTEVIAIGLQ
jgi:hypothetical protein